MNELSIKNLVKHYHTKKILDNISLDFKAGEFVAIVGPSGSGKSTLLRCIAKLANFSSGKITLNEISYDKISNKDFKKEVSIIFQDFNLISRLSVFTNIILGRLHSLKGIRKLLCLFSKEDKQKTLQSLSKVGMLEYIFSKCSSLSGGQQQRVAIARAITHRPSILLADEPVANLDPKNAIKILDLFKAINKELNTTVIINIHQFEFIEKYFDRLIGIRNGKVIYDVSLKSKGLDLSQIYQDIYYKYD